MSAPLGSLLAPGSGLQCHGISKGAAPGPQVQLGAPARPRRRRPQALPPRSAWGGHEQPPKDLAKDPEARFRQ